MSSRSFEQVGTSICSAKPYKDQNFLCNGMTDIVKGTGCASLSFRVSWTSSLWKWRCAEEEGDGLNWSRYFLTSPDSGLCPSRIQNQSPDFFTKYIKIPEVTPIPYIWDQRPAESATSNVWCFFMWFCTLASLTKKFVQWGHFTVPFPTSFSIKNERRR